MKKNKIAIIAGLLFLVCFGALYTILYVVPDIVGAHTATTIVQYGQMQISSTQKCLVVRNEELVYADHSGRVTYYVDENTKTRSGSKILDISDSDGINGYSCAETGIISFYKDGLESVFTPSNIEEITKEQIESEADREPYLVKTDEIRKGDVCYKLIKSEAWNVVFCISLEESKQYNVGDSITISLEQGEVDANVSTIIRRVDKDEALIILQTVKYFADFTYLRHVEAEIIVSVNKGIIIPNTAITEVDGNKGVYVKNVSDEYDFTRINILADNGTDSCVSVDTFTETQPDGSSKTFLTVSNYDEVLRYATEYSE